MLNVLLVTPIVNVSASALDLTQYVNPFIATHYRQAEPSAVVPFGMISAGPTTSGNTMYQYDNTTITGFAFEPDVYTSLAGFMPVTNSITISPKEDRAYYSSAYSHSNESASPGYYQVLLQDSNTNVELTVTKRTAMTKVTYPSGSTPKMLIYANAQGNTRTGEINIDVANKKVYGHIVRSSTLTQYFVMYFDTAFTKYGTWNGTSLSDDSTYSSGDVGAYVEFGSTNLQMKTAISFVSLANAELNLSAENPNWDFVATRTAAEDEWNTILNRIQVTSNGKSDDIDKFYSFLYVALKNPHTLNDVNGEYPGYDGSIYTASNYTKYYNLPGWDMYRSTISLVSLVAPSVTEDIAKSILSFYEQAGGFFTYGSYNGCSFARNLRKICTKFAKFLKFVLREKCEIFICI